MNKAVIGLQWGDEGKGKIVDYLSENFDLVVRYQGGNNAGHTVIVEDITYKLNLIPSGVIRDKICFLGQGVVLDPEHFVNEYEKISKRISNPRIYLSSNISLILNYHKQLDKINESILTGDSKIGTTAKGIGPAYQDKVGRKSIKLYDLDNMISLKSKFEAIKKYYDPILDAFDENKIDLNQNIERLSEFYSQIKSLIIDNSFIKKNFQNKKILFEGAQGILLDVDHGTYPFVTSSNTVASSAATGSGCGPNSINYVLGITKAYTTRVGSGPFPTELNDEIGESLGRRGKEFGTVTARKRRCGWFDGVLVRQTIKIAGINGIALTKLDVLDELDEIKVCIQYELNGKKIDYLPSSSEDQFKIKPIYKTFPGWKSQTRGIRNIQDLPEKAKNYIYALEDFIGAKISSISTSPERDDTILIEDPFKV